MRVGAGSSEQQPSRRDLFFFFFFNLTSDPHCLVIYHLDQPQNICPHPLCPLPVRKFFFFFFFFVSLAQNSTCVMWKEKKLKDCDCDFFFFLPNKRFRWGGAGWSRGWDASFRRVKTHSSPSPVAKKKKKGGGEDFLRKVPHTGLFLLQEDALPLAPSRLTHGPMSKTGWAAASTNLHTHTHTKRRCPRWKPIGVSPSFSFLSFLFIPGFWISQISCAVRYPCRGGELISSMQNKWKRSQHQWGSV